MLTADAQIRTDRPSRYLEQLCRHASKMGRHRLSARAHRDGGEPPEVQHVEWSDTYGMVRLSWGQWSVRSGPELLTVQAEAANLENLRRIQALVAERLERIGRRDHLTVTWQPPKETDMADPSRYPDTGDDGGQDSTPAAPRWMIILAISGAIALVALVAILHLTGVVGPK